MTNIDLSKSEQFTLSIRLSADGFSFSIHHLPGGDEGGGFSVIYPINASYSMTANIKEMIAATADTLKRPFRRTNILIDTPRYTPVPFDLFEDEQAEDFFHHNFTENSNETILCNILGKTNVALLFGVDKHAHQLLCEHFPTARIFAGVSPLSEYFSQRSREGSQRKVYVHFRKSCMEVFAFDKGKLLLMNTLGSKQTADNVYYLLYVWQQLGFSQEKDELFLAGEVNEEIQTELKKFLRRVTVIRLQDDLPFDIQTLMICE